MTPNSSISRVSAFETRPAQPDLSAELGHDAIPIRSSGDAEPAQVIHGAARRAEIGRIYPALAECPCLPVLKRQRFVERMADATASRAAQPSTLHWYDLGSGSLLHLATQAEALSLVGVRSVHFHVIELQSVSQDVARDFTRHLLDLSARSGGNFRWSQPSLLSFQQQVADCAVHPVPDVATLVDPDTTSHSVLSATAPATHVSILDLRSGDTLFADILMAHQGLPLLADIAAARSGAATARLSELQDRAESYIMASYHVARRASLGNGADSSFYFRMSLLQFLPKKEFVLMWKDDPNHYLTRLSAVYPQTLIGRLTHQQSSIEIKFSA